jgi:hypothetical protein
MRVEISASRKLVAVHVEYRVQRFRKRSILECYEKPYSLTLKYM